jgi:hypothetical protein
MPHYQKWSSTSSADRQIAIICGLFILGWIAIELLEMALD